MVLYVGNVEPLVQVVSKYGIKKKKDIHYGIIKRE